jgi:hypothetical protein
MQYSGCVGPSLSPYSYDRERRTSLHRYLKYFFRCPDNKNHVYCTRQGKPLGERHERTNYGNFLLARCHSLVPCYAGTRKVLRSPPHPASGTQTTRRAISAYVSPSRRPCPYASGAWEIDRLATLVRARGPRAFRDFSTVVQRPTCCGPCLAFSDWQYTA